MQMNNTNETIMYYLPYNLANNPLVLPPPPQFLAIFSVQLAFKFKNYIISPPPPLSHLKINCNYN